MGERYDAIVIGAGIVGVSTAIYLQERGHSVLLIDKKGIAQETSYGNAGILDTGYVLPFAPPRLGKIPRILLGKEPAARIALPDAVKYLGWIANYYQNSLKQKRYQNGMQLRPLIEGAVKDHKFLLKGTAGLRHIKNYGRAKLYRSQKSFKSASEELELLKDCGVRYEVFDAEEFREREPDVKPNYYRAVTYEGSARYTNPGKAIGNMGRKFVGQGGDVSIENVTRIKKIEDGWAVNQHRAKNVVICAGPWANDLLNPLGHKFPIAMKRGYHKHFKSLSKVSHALVDVDVGYVICPMEQGVRITTGVEFAKIDTPSNPVQIDQVLPKAKELVDLTEVIEDKAWLGARPCMADSLPVIGQSKKHKGLWFNFAHGHVGLTAGPASGKLLAQMLSNEKTFCDPEPYSAQRFS